MNKVFKALADRTRLGEANRLGVQSSVYVNSTLQNAEVIQALGMLGPLRQRWSLLQQRIIAAQAHASDRGARITSATRFVRISGQSLALGLGALLGERGIACRILNATREKEEAEIVAQAGTFGAVGQAEIVRGDVADGGGAIPGDENILPHSKTEVLDVHRCA